MGAMVSISQIKSPMFAAVRWTADFESGCRKNGLLECVKSGNWGKNESRRLILS
jgi:hypothetical protein